MGESANVDASAASGSNSTAMGMTAAGGIASAYGSYKAGQLNKQIAKQNARYAKQQADQAVQAGDFAANRIATREQQIEGADRATAAGNGVVANAGSAKLVQASNAAQSNMDEFLTRLNARREAYGFQARAASDSFQGEIAGMTGTNQAISTMLNTGAQEWLESDPNYAGLRGSGVRFA